MKTTKEKIAVMQHYDNGGGVSWHTYDKPNDLSFSDNHSIRGKEDELAWNWDKFDYDTYVTLPPKMDKNEGAVYQYLYKVPGDAWVRDDRYYENDDHFMHVNDEIIPVNIKIVRIKESRIKIS